MNKILFLAVITTFLVAGCGDKDDAASGKTEPSMLEKAKESTKGAMSDIKGATSEAMDGAGKMASDTESAVGNATSNAKDAASKMASDTKTAVTAAASTAMDKSGDMASDAAEAVGMSSDGADDGGAVGVQVYQKSCQSCHAMGVAGAPKQGDKAAWAPRIATGMDALVASAINGKNIMPPRGACASCSDDDIKAAVQYMVSQSK